jgi:2,3-bisphosphoglycerate-independent phosphoglycerate mutase
MRAKKYVILLGDGMPDQPIPERDNKTPLMMAPTPNLDKIVQQGTAGSAKTTPDGFEPGSDVTNMGIMGFDPEKYYSGRSPLEAAAMGVELGPDDVAFRMNLCTLTPVYDGLIMSDFSAGHIETEDAAEIVADMQKRLGDERFQFYPGVSYRHLMVWKGGDDSLKLTPPHDISDQNVRPYLPDSKLGEPLHQLMNEAQMFLKNHPINRRRKAENKKEANSVWFWGQGKKPVFPTLAENIGLTGAVITAVDLMRGIAINAGMKVINVPGATGWIDTNYDGKSAACLDALKDVDFVYIHVESPDEAGHAGSLDYKVQAITDFDAKVVGPIMEGLEAAGYDYRVMALSDHPTPVALKTHTLDNVVFGIYPAIDDIHANAFDEAVIETSPLRFDSAVALNRYFIEGER